MPCLTEPLKQEIREAYARLAGTMPGFCRRPQQQVMVAEVSKALTVGPDEVSASFPKIALINGPTGVGKTVGYLLPALLVARARKLKLVVSTGTVALQEQLINKDLPALARYAGLTFTAVLAKGRGRYLCVERLKHCLGADGAADGAASAVWERPPTRDELQVLDDLGRGFDAGHWNGDRDALPQSVEDGLWRRVTNDGTGCAGRKCPGYDSCAYFKARAQIESADVVVANHDLVLTAYANEGSALPDLSSTLLVMDEAHHVPDTAIAHSAASFSVGMAASWARKLPVALTAAFKIAPNPALETRMREASVQIASLLSLFQGDAITDLAETGDLSVDRPMLFRKGIVPPEIQERLEAMAKLVSSLSSGLGALLDAISAAASAGLSNPEACSRAQMDLFAFGARFASVEETLEMLALPSAPDGLPVAKWLSLAPRADDVLLNASFVSAANLLPALLWGPAAGVVLTSATMASLTDFAFFRRSAGLLNLPVRELDLPSPFDFPSQGALAVPKMRSNPSVPAAHTAELQTLIPSYIAEATTGCLILCTSRKQMDAIYSAIPADLLTRVLRQGDLPKQQIVAAHMAAIDAGRPSVILALQSFGEGVDLPGRYCEHLVITKLPFAPPDGPVDAALAEWLEANGRNSFAEISLPRAALKLVQWAGRLIRTETDTGRVTLLDRRVVSKPYGRLLVASLPPFRQEMA